VTGPLPPPVSPFETFFFLRSQPAGTPQSARLRGHLSEPRGLADRPISGRFWSLSGPLLRRNRTTAVLVRMLEAQQFNGLEDARRGAGLKGAPSGGVNWDRTVRSGSCPSAHITVDLAQSDRLDDRAAPRHPGRPAAPSPGQQCRLLAQGRGRRGCLDGTMPPGRRPSPSTSSPRSISAGPARRSPIPAARSSTSPRSPRDPPCRAGTGFNQQSFFFRSTPWTAGAKPSGHRLPFLTGHHALD
jgi:hypothetical protein